MTDQITKEKPDAGQNSEPEFTVGQLVSVYWDRLGEITKILAGGYYEVWVEGDDRLGSGFHPVHQNSLEAIR